MSVQNQEIAALFTQVAQLLEIDGANPFRVRAYQNAALAILNWSRSLAEMLRQNEDLSQIPGVGKDLADKIKEIVLTGKLPQREELLQRLPPGLLKMLKLPGLGPKRVRSLYTELKITSLDQLRAAAESGTIKTLAGFGPKLERQILLDLDRPELQSQRRLWADLKPVVDELVLHLSQVRGVKNVVPAGSYRRCAETVGDLDILATAADSEAAMQAFVGYEDVATVTSRGDTRSTVVFRSGLQVDLRVVPEASLGAALQYFTGSKSHNVEVRKLAQRKSLKINEYGLFRGSRRTPAKTEAEIYRALGLEYIEPELREMRGELEAARQGTLPKLVTRADIRGDLHAHTDATDGTASLKAMAEAARAHGYAYLAITDHSQRVTVAHGLDAARLSRQLDAIDRLNETLPDFTILKSLEVDILENGSLDLDESLLKRLDLTVCSVHSKFNLDQNRQTERILRAMDNPYFTILGHPTGRILNERPAYEIDMEKIIAGARERGCFLELNSHPARLDLSDGHCRLAKDLGVKIAISTDAHSLQDFEQMAFGLNQARRGWLEASDVLNARPLKELKKLMSRK